MPRSIQNDLDRIMAAIYGEEVRGSIHDAIETCYDDVQDGKTLADAAATNANAKANLANAAATAANTAATNANNKADIAYAAATAADDATAATTAAITAATNAATNANAKAALADEKATLANTKADLANTKANLANTAASTATEKANLANEKATLANTAAATANTAASNADAKATLANTAAETATTAAANANTKATLAYQKATLADTAATAANTAASNADAKATLANTAASNANTKATLADEKATLADTKATLANTAAAAANTAASNATTAASTANTAAGTANTAASNADTKATLADEKATLANTAAASATSAASAANTAAGNADLATTAANTAAASATSAATTATTASSTASNAAAAATSAAADAEDAVEEISHLVEQWDLDDELDGTSDHGIENQAVVKGLNTKASVITDTASGEIVTVPDGAEGIAAKSLVVHMEPIQDLHGYDYPWPAGGGKNLLPYDLNWYNSGNDLASGKAFWVKAGVYALSFIESSATSWRWYIKAFNEDKTEVSTAGDEISGLPYSAVAKGYQTEANITNKKISFTVLKDCNLAFGIRLGDGTTSSTFTNCQLETGTEQTSYAPYSNECPISGRTGVMAYRTGVNVWDEEWELGTINSTTGVNEPAVSTIRSKNYISVLPNTDYYVRSNATIGFRFYDADHGYIGYSVGSNVVKKTPANCRYMRFIAISTTTYNHDISINYPATDTDYHAYTGASYPVSWQSEAGTVYGGTLDIMSGVLTVDRVMVEFDGTNGTFKTGTINYLRYDPISSIRPDYSRRTETVSNQYHNISSGAQTDQAIRIATDNTIILVYDSRFTSESAMRTLLSQNPVQIVYPLRPQNIQTYQLTPIEVAMLLGVNNVFSDSGSIDLVYPCDTKLYIEKLTQPTEDDMIANNNIAADTFFMIDNALYFSTTAISAGETIVVGTNCSRVSLADALNSLNSSSSS